MKTNSIYSSSPKEFIERFDKAMDREQENLWQAEFQRFGENKNFEFEFDEIEEVLEKSDFQRELFSKHQKRFTTFNSMIPEFDSKELSLVKEDIINETVNFVDYIYCLNKYYGFLDRMIARSVAIARRFNEKLPVNLQRKV